jgi:hypothetical protein
MPDRDIRGMMENVNYQTILAVLLRKPDKNAAPGERACRSREYLFKQLASQYVPTRTKRTESLPEDPWKALGQSKKERKTIPVLSHGTFSDFLKSLEEAELVERQESKDGSRQKGYQITDAGETAFRFLADPETSTLVRDMLERG